MHLRFPQHIMIHREKIISEQNLIQLHPAPSTQIIYVMQIQIKLDLSNKNQLHWLPSPSSKLMAILSLTMPDVVLEEASLMTE